ncbi:phage tail family protein [Staphylococcus ureilyticus]|uniref:phage tail family protein n=1 Tax=Staphylococcus ureilyticus TaxID=94138 RepID=UPI002157FEFB|nr:phage tail family protein [Staphylococcus ureilyticus]MDV3053605.1 phage tail family protein [Staphylococcus ureilyticus]
MEKTVKIIGNDFETVLTDIPKLRFLDYNEEGVEVQVNSTEMKGRDGVGLLGPATFGPFNLVLRFFYSGQDLNDYKLIKQKMRGLLFRREPYLIVHSDQPGKKYSVYCNENAIEDIGTRFGIFEVKFVVYKGYSESLLDTGQYSLSNANKWQFEGGNLSDSNIKYKHTTTNFRIYNGSTDAINPTLGYEMKIKINVDAPNGFKLTNNTTGDVFEYKKAIKKNQQLVIDGVHPIINKQRVGKDTNWGWINLKEGFNDIEITGKSLGSSTVEFIFNFVYR